MRRLFIMTSLSLYACSGAPGTAEPQPSDEVAGAEVRSPGASETSAAASPAAGSTSPNAASSKIASSGVVERPAQAEHLRAAGGVEVSPTVGRFTWMNSPAQLRRDTPSLAEVPLAHAEEEGPSAVEEQRATFSLARATQLKSVRAFEEAAR